MLIGEEKTAGDIYALSCACHPEHGYAYVGQTVSGITARRNQHVSDAFNRPKNLPVLNWIRKHGSADRSNILVTAIESDVPLRQLDEREIHWIAFHNSRVPNGKNVTLGGGGASGHSRKHTPEERRHMSKKMAGRKPSPRAIDGVRKMMLTKIGKDNYNSVLKNEDVEDILHRLNQGASAVDIAKMYDINVSTVYQIRAGKTWKHIPRPYGPRQIVRPTWMNDIDGHRMKLSNSGKLRADDVREIKVMLANGVPYKQIMGRFDISRSAVYNVKIGHTWGWV
ncbi:MAG: helix-turn-helix domain-containing protein [Candidatus Absconditicoccaceae bacterium]